MSKIFICDEKNEVFNRWFNGVHQEAIKTKDTKMEFLKKQAKSIEKEWANHWDSLFEELKEAGLIAKAHDREDYTMEITKNPVQFFIERRDSSGQGMPAFLKALLGAGMPGDEE